MNDKNYNNLVVHINVKIKNDIDVRRIIRNQKKSLFYQIH